VTIFHARLAIQCLLVPANAAARRKLEFCCWGERFVGAQVVLHCTSVFWETTNGTRVWLFVLTRYYYFFACGSFPKKNPTWAAAKEVEWDGVVSEEKSPRRRAITARPQDCCGRCARVVYQLYLLAAV
jgi:hypothetical protein